MNKVASRRSRVASIIFWATALVPAVVMLVVPVVVLQDGGLHLSNAVALRGLAQGLWPALLEWRPILAPNAIVELVLAGLTTFMDANDAVKVVAVIGAVGFACAVAA